MRVWNEQIYGEEGERAIYCMYIYIEREPSIVCLYIYIDIYIYIYDVTFTAKKWLKSTNLHKSPSTNLF